MESMKNRATKRQRNAMRRSAIVDSMDEKDVLGAPPPETTLAAWALRPYHPAYLRGALFFALFAGLSFGTARLLDVPFSPTIDEVLVYTLATVAGFFLFRSVQNVVISAGVGPKAFKAARARTIAVRSFIALAAILVSSGLALALHGLGTFVMASALVWTGMAIPRPMLRIRLGACLSWVRTALPLRWLE